MADKNMKAKINVEFEEAASRQQINSGEDVSTLFGKIRKFLADLKAVAFSGAYSDLSGTPDLTQYASKAKYGDTAINVGRKSGTTAGANSTAEGYNTTASGYCSHAEGVSTTASGAASHAEGNSTTASNYNSHAEGYDTTASGDSSHAGGFNSKASGANSFAHGNNAQVLHDHETAFGKYNNSNDDTLFSVGDGTSDSARHNAFEITTTGGKLHDKDIATTDTTFQNIGVVADLFAVNKSCICIYDPNTLNTPLKAGLTSSGAGLCIVNFTAGAAYADYLVIPAGDTAYFAANSINGSLYDTWRKINDGGNASTIGGKSVSDFIYPRGYFTGNVDDIKYPYCGLVVNATGGTPPTPVWGTLLCYAGGTGSFVQLWVSSDDNATMFKRHFNGSTWSDWKEISTTPIKSTGWITTPTNEYGKIVLPNSDSRGYISVTVAGCYNQMYMDNDNYVFCVTDGIFNPQVNTAISYIAYYIE